MITFADAKPRCELFGHHMVTYLTPPTLTHDSYWTFKYESCKNCGIKLKHSKYKWHPWYTEEIK